MLPMLGTDPEVVGIARDAKKLVQLGLPEQLVDYAIPGAFGLPIGDVKHPDIDLPYGKLRPDGLAFEFTVDPSNDVHELVERIRANLVGTQELAMQYSGSVLSVEPHVYTHQRWIDMLPKEYGTACSLQMLGCARDFCIYDVAIPSKPDPRTHNYRTTGGHIHIQVGQDITKDKAAHSCITAALDQVIGTAATYLCPSAQAFRRKELYGQSGMIRVNNKLGIIEYRTLPAQALIQTPYIAELMFTAAQNIAAWMIDVYTNTPQTDAIKIFDTVTAGYWYCAEDVATAINSHAVDACRQIQLDFLSRLPSEAGLTAVVGELQRYVLPDNNFALLGWS